MIIQQINIRTQDSNLEENYAKMKEQRVNNGFNNNSFQQEDININELLAANKEEEEKSVDVSKMNEILTEMSNMVNVYFQFEWDADNRQEMLLKVFNKETKEMIRQYPSEISLKIVQMLEKSLGNGRIADMKL